jgi:uncharacterized membrane protein YphA (DoxX/SURF4 family)
MKPRESSASEGPLAWIGLAVRLGAAAIWVVAGAAKIPQIQAFQVLVQRYGILPGFLTGPFAYVLPFLEIALGLYLAAGLFVRGTAFLGTVLFAAFLTAQMSALIRGISLDCGCFGSIAETTVGPLTMLRDFSLGIPTFLMLAFPARLFSLDRRIFGAVNLFGGLRRQDT